MKAEHRFLHTYGGITRFARVAVRTEPAGEWAVVFAPSLGDLAVLYGDALRSGISMAARRHEELGGRRHRVEVESLMATAVDTSPDAVRCAVAVAAWKSFGRDPVEISTSFADGQWEVTFEASR